MGCGGYLSPVNSNLWRRAACVPLFFGVGLLAGLSARPDAVLAAYPAPASTITLVETTPIAPSLITQDSGDSSENEASPAEVEKYVAVYKAMQHDRTLTISRAASGQGLTLGAFRDLENKIQRDGGALERAREELQADAAGASPTPASSPGAALPTK
jgi:hypothetical protein